MKRKALGLPLLLAVACSASDRPTESLASTSSPVIAGASSPDDLHYPIGKLQKNAAVAQVAYGSQGCSGTIIGDRLVVSAAHCVVLNQDEWANGAAPQVVSPSKIKYVVGGDIRSPLCTLNVESVHVHPNAKQDLNSPAILHDVSISVLSESVSATCPQVVPIAPNREALQPALVGQWLLQGGFGSLASTYDFSPVRYWSLVKTSGVTPDYVAFRAEEHGAPTYGDSGSGFLRRFPDGSLRCLGVDSMGFGLLGTFVRLDAQAAFLDSMITPERLCGPVSAQGLCRDDVAVWCDSSGFQSKDCGSVGASCVMSEGKAKCECACDTTGGCDQGCACDPTCGTPPGETLPSCSSAADLMNTASCGDGYTCDIADLITDAPGCRKAGSSAAYGPCGPSSSPCVAGSMCLELPGKSAGCAPFCDAQHPCSATTACIPTFQVTGKSVATCWTPDNCDLAVKSCPSGQSCLLLEGGRFCFRVGQIKEGQACTYVNDCAVGLACADPGVCRRWCKSKSTCASGFDCVGIGSVPAQPDVGLCEPASIVEDAGADASTDATTDAKVEDDAAPQKDVSAPEPQDDGGTQDQGGSGGGSATPDAGASIPAEPSDSSCSAVRPGSNSMQALATASLVALLAALLGRRRRSETVVG